MKTLLIFVFVLLLLPCAYASELLYDIELDVFDEVTLVDVSIIEGQMPLQLSDYVESYEAKVMSFGGNNLLSVNFSLSTFAYDSDLPVDVGPVHVIASYFPNAKSVNVYNPAGNEVLKIDVSGFSRCNEDGFCDYNENEKSCPGDCTKEEVASRESKLDEKESVIETGMVVSGQAKQYWPYLLVLALALVIAAVIIIKARKK